MRQRKLERPQKRQKGQFLTPTSLAHDIVRALDLSDVRRILEPACGDGPFLRALVARLAESTGRRPQAPVAWGETPGTRRPGAPAGSTAAPV